MNLRYHFVKSLAYIARLIPPSFHHQVLNLYLRNPELSLRHGIVCLRQDYSSPITVEEDTDFGLLGQMRELPGINLDVRAIENLGNEISHFACEFPWRSDDGKPNAPWGFMFPTIDSVVLYSMIRCFKPSTYIEVGCGYSSRVSSAACEKNRSEDVNSRSIYIEPYPGERLDRLNLSGELVVKRIQELSPDYFRILKAGDILFIDTSHIMKCQSDVEWELLHILPSLASGVIVHIHDVYTPFEYPVEWLHNNYAPGRYNEQYALEALLSGGNRFKPLFPNHWLCRELGSMVNIWFGAEPDESRSFWLVVS